MNLPTSTPTSDGRARVPTLVVDARRASASWRTSGPSLWCLAVVFQVPVCVLRLAAALTEPRGSESLSFGQASREIIRGTKHSN